MTSRSNPLVVRLAADADVEDVADMVEDFVRGHPAAGRPRPLERPHAAYFGRSSTSPWNA